LIKTLTIFTIILNKKNKISKIILKINLIKKVNNITTKDNT